MSILKDVTTAVLLLCLMPLVAEAREGAGSYPRQDKSLAELENRIEETDHALEQLAHYTLRGGVGAIGYRTPFRSDSRHRESITISWGKEEPIDEIIIVPVISRAEVNHYEAEGFPLEFRVLCGSSDSTNGTEIASFSESDRLLP